MLSTVVAVLYALPVFAPPGNPPIETIVDRLTQHDTENSRTDISWQVSRDSRILDLTALNSEGDGRVWRLRTDQTHTRLDGWSPLESVNDRRPDQSFASRSRSAAQFTAYLQSGFEKAAPETIFEQRTVVFSDKLRWPDEWGSLDRLLASGASIATRSFSNKLLPIQPGSLSVHGEIRHSLNDDRLILVRETQDDGSYRDLWLSTNRDLRPRRWMEILRGEIVRQLDFEWSEGGETQLRKWTAQVFDPNSGYHEFADATVVRFSNPSHYERDVFSAALNTVNVESRRINQGVSDRVRLVIQWLFEWTGLMTAAAFVIVIVVLRHYRRVPSQQDQQ
ncbi:MAG: hypothetical protein R3C59_05230 [Planctomycetaceae bacterium]